MSGDVNLAVLGSDNTVGGPGGSPVTIYPWQATTAYVVDQPVTQSGALQICNTPHTSGNSFDQSKWTVINGSTSGVLSFNTRSGVVTLTKGDVTGTGLGAADVSADAAGAAAAVQAASLQKTSNLFDVVDSGTARANLKTAVLTPAAAVSTSNVASLSGLLTIDAYTLTGTDLVLLVGQTNAAQNGLWQASSGAWTRPTEFANGSSVRARLAAVINGTINAKSLWLLQTNASLVVGTDPQTWVQVSSASGGGGSAPVVQGTVGGSLGATQTIDFANTAKKVILVGSLTANLTITLSNRAAGSEAVLLLTQDTTGNRTLTISDGGTSSVVSISATASTLTMLGVECPDVTTIDVVVLGGSTGGGTTGALLATNNLSDLGSVPTARTNLGLGTSAVAAIDTVAGDFVANGTAAAGSTGKVADAGHVHPTDTTRAPLNSPGLTGTPTSTTPTLGDNSTKIATTAFVLANGGTALLIDGGNTTSTYVANIDGGASV